MAAQIEPDAMRRIQKAVWELADMEYPRVWISVPGMTADELLSLQMENDEGPEWLRVEPGEWVRAEGAEEGSGLRVPEVSHRWLDGLWVYENMPHALSGYALAELEFEVLHVFAAKQDKVPVQTLLKQVECIWRRHREPLDGLVVLRHFDPDSDTPGYTTLTRLVPVDRLAPDDVSQELIDALEIYADRASGNVYVIDDSEQARNALEKRLNS